MIIAIDMDEVLADLMTGIIEYHNTTYGTTLKKEDFVTQKFWKTWGGTRQQAIDKVRDFYKTDIFKNLKPVTGAKEAVKTLGRQHDLQVITARPLGVADITHAWLNEHFPNTFSKIHITNHYAFSGDEKRKSQVCNEEGIHIMIEDSYEYAMDCVSDERKVFLLRYPWNAEHTDLPKNIHRVDSWKDIVDNI